MTFINRIRQFNARHKGEAGYKLIKFDLILFAVTLPFLCCKISFMTFAVVIWYINIILRDIALMELDRWKVIAFAWHRISIKANMRRKRSERRYKQCKRQQLTTDKDYEIRR